MRVTKWVFCVLGALNFSSGIKSMRSSHPLCSAQEQRLWFAPQADAEGFYFTKKLGAKCGRVNVYLKPNACRSKGHAVLPPRGRTSKDISKHKAENRSLPKALEE